MSLDAELSSQRETEDIQATLLLSPPDDGNLPLELALEKMFVPDVSATRDAVTPSVPSGSVERQVGVAF